MHRSSMRSNSATYASGFAVAPNLSRQVVLVSRERRDEPFPWIQGPDTTFSSVTTEISVEAWFLQRADNVDILAIEAADSLVDLFQGQRVFFCSQVAPSSLDICVLCDLVAWREQVVDNRRESYSRTYPCSVALEISHFAENSGPADQKNEAENPFQMPEQLDVATIQFNRVIDVQACFVVCAAIAHFLTCQARCRSWYGIRRWISVRWNLRFVFYITLLHGDSFLRVRVLGSPEILACESSPFLLSASTQVEPFSLGIQSEGFL